MRWLLLACCLLAGCAGPAGPATACDRVATAPLTVERITGDDILTDGGSLVLHAAGSDVRVWQAGDCREASVADLRVGDRIGHDATGYAHSYPAQAWPATLVAHR